MKKIVLKIEGMQCPNCAMILESIEDNFKGWSWRKLVIIKHRWLWNIEENQVTEEEIKSEIQRLGYNVSAVV